MARKALLIGGVLLLGAWGATAQEKEVSYFCASEFAGGVAYNAVGKRWQGTTFRTRDKFVLKLKLIESAAEQHVGTGKYDIYSVTITLGGTNFASPCVKGGMGMEDARKILVGRSGVVECGADLTEYRFNIRNNRFIAAYLAGYVDGVDNNNNTPSIDGGTCTKIQ